MGVLRPWSCLSGEMEVWVEGLRSWEIPVNSSDWRTPAQLAPVMALGIEKCSGCGDLHDN